MYKTRIDAEKAAKGNAVIQVDGGYLVCNWNDYNYSIREEALSLKALGWTAKDADALMAEYGFDLEHVQAVCSEMED